ncbi:MAG TPA: 3-oxoacyl-[acyl-carrier-protein] synthase III C-terminal domain-containing protein [Kofleriaceae bacterium]|jgi:3-oxoacyl-[acyl-carrier-protein] synthase-3|nr:3-oxoacyl-[acyl-carrier-protein] synthase III C-terminal domain-containing protein [Kofleriaceae bacterium]
MPGITIVGSGRHVPGAPVPNDALARVMDTDDAWIRQRTGIAQRHYAPDGVGASDLAVEASRRALDDAGLTPADVDYIVFATMTPDHPFPGPGGMLGAKLGIPGVPALDIRQQCAAMPFAFQVADGLCATGAASTVLVVGAEAHAGFMPWTDWDVVEGTAEREVSPADRERASRHRGLAVIFGDGAGALVLRRHPEPGRGLLGVEVHSDGHGARLIHIDGGGFRRRPHWAPWMLEQELHIPRMEGRELFKSAVTKLPQVVRSLCDKHGVALGDVDWFVAHQANDRINDAVRGALGVAPERVPSNIARYGNTSGATIPILVDELRRDGKLRPGQLVCFLALGAGLHWGAALMRI